MRIIDRHNLTEISKLNKGEIFEASAVYWLISDFEKGDSSILCIDTESGHAQFFCPEYQVTPLTAEVHIL